MSSAALVLCADGLVRAYDTVASARAAHPAAGVIHGASHGVTEFGAKAAPQDGKHHYMLLVEAAAVAGSVPAVTAVLDESLLRTNVQKAVRRMDAAAAHASVLQYFAQRPPTGTNEYQKKLLVRLAVMAAEDATTVPLLPTAIFHLLGGTSLGHDAAHGAAATLAACAAQLAAAPRDPACTSAGAWRVELLPKEKLINRPRPRPFDQEGCSALDAAQVILIDCAARIVGRRENLEGLWLFALERAMCARLSAGDPVCMQLSAPAMAAVPAAASLQADGTLVPEGKRFTFSADFHNKVRWERLFPALKGVGGLGTKTKVKSAMRQEALRNVRDHGVVHLLTVPTAPATENAPFEERWRAVARALWAAQPAAPAPAGKKAGGGKKRVGGSGPAAAGAAEPEGGGKQQKLS